MSASENARKAVLAVEIDRDELALRIAEQCIGLYRRRDIPAAEALDEMDGIAPGFPAKFRRAADAAVLFFHECVNAGRQPS